MPRLPTMRVIGSQFISTRLLPIAVLVAEAMADSDLPLWPTPVRFLVHGRLCERSQRPNRPAVDGDGGRGELGAGRLVHEGHELVGEARHRAADADASDVGTAADAVHPAALADVALHHGAPAAELHDALGRAVRVREVGLLV